MTQYLTTDDPSARVRRCLDAVRRFKALHRRLALAAPSLTPQERRTADEPFDPAFPRYCTKTEKLDRAIEDLYSRWCHAEDPATLFADRTVPVARAFSDLFELIDKLSARL